ncbi:NAD(P)H-binding protein [Glycomyces buryatensis]|uniref:NAD-dependent epimerase/dehydratase family protein n=1 Tax=Glycomyces buryatensis TaxID=2570927 RepID=A0A4S8QG09_9ACTN|nr:NAD(P)H-binding protein [Glycomyces buryatensis]THV41875.1 NAD-dependent epimerase/dehydratase family protein [Glycomyces buryatensis]
MSENHGKTILVIGATGKVGRRLTEQLRAAGHDVRGVSRRTAIPFDWHDASTWGAALEGVSAAYIIPPDEPIPAREFVTAAANAGVQRLVSQSGRRIHVLVEAAGAGPDDVAMYAMQEALKHSGVEWTVLQANNFNQNFSEGDNLPALLAGELALPLRGTTEPFIDVEDIAAVAVAVLTEDGHSGQIYELSGPESISFEDAVQIIAKAAGKEITFRAEDPEDYVEALKAAGVPEPLIEFLDVMYGVMREGKIADVADGVQAVLGREPVAFADWAARAAKEGSWVS